MNFVSSERAMRCPACTSMRDASLPDGLCARCLLTFALEAESSAPADDLLADDVAPGIQRNMGRYQLHGEIDRGGVGIVYRAWQADLKREVALKMLLPARSETPDSLYRFRREAELMASLEHPGILPVYEVGEQDGVPYYSMKLAEGGNLAARIPTLRGQFRECARLVAVLARAINYAHGHGVLHRDLKPSNIVFDAGGACLVTDFGLARRLAVDSSLTGIDALIGTPRYVAPEVVTTSGAQLTAAADVYGLGAIFYELLSGRAPFFELTPVQILQQIATRRPRPLRQYDAAIPAGLEAICLRCLEKRPGDRFESAGALADALERWLARSQSAAARWPLRWSRSLPSQRRTRVRVAAVVCLLGAIALTILWTRPASPSMPDPRLATRTLVVLPTDLPKPPPAELAAARALSARLQGKQPLDVAAIEPLLARAQTADFPPFALGRGLALGALVQVQVHAVGAGAQAVLHVRAIDALRGELLWQGQAKAADIDGMARALGAALVARRRAPPPEAALPRAALAAFARGAALYHRFDSSANDAAIDAFKQAIAIDPAFALAHAYLSSAYSQRSNRFGSAAFWNDSAIEEAERAARLDPTLAAASEALGYAYYNKGWWQRSTAIYEHARALGSLGAVGDLALNYYGVGRFDESFQLYRQSLEFAPRGINFYLAAQVLLTLGATDAGAQWMRAAIAREPHAGKRRLMEAEIALYRGDYLRCRTLAGALDPDLVSGGFGSAGDIARRCAEHQHDWPAALAALAHDKQHYANGTGDLGNAGPALEEAVLLHELGRDAAVTPVLAQARRAAQAAIDGDREYPKIFLRMASVLRLSGENDAAYRMLDSAFAHGLSIDARNDADFEFLPFQSDARFAQLRKASLAKVAAMRERVLATLHGHAAQTAPTGT